MKFMIQSWATSTW